MGWVIVRVDPDRGLVYKSYIREDGHCYYLVREMTPEERVMLTPSSVRKDPEGEQ